MSHLSQLRTFGHDVVDALDEDEASVSVQSCLFASSSCMCVVRR